MNEQIRDLLDELATAVAHIKNDEHDRVLSWIGKRNRIAMQLGEAWANETADAPE